MRRLPARDSRWRCWSPDEASKGAVPVQDAKRLRSANRATSPTSARIRAAPGRDYQYFPPSSDPSFFSPTPAFVAALPDAPGELREYLNSTVSGSNSHDEALFAAVTDLAQSHLLDPATLRDRTRGDRGGDGVETEDVVIVGRQAVEISFRRFHLDLIGVQSFTIDKQTAQVLQVRSSSPDSTHTSTTTMVETTDAIPDAVLAAFETYGNEGRVCADGTEAEGGEGC